MIGYIALRIGLLYMFFRAMEDRKRCMVAAEEERKRRILDDRRLFQQEATDRFRLATERCKTTESSYKGVTGKLFVVVCI